MGDMLLIYIVMKTIAKILQFGMVSSLLITGYHLKKLETFCVNSNKARAKIVLSLNSMRKCKINGMNIV
jgi:hypothetical protein